MSSGLLCHAGCEIDVHDRCQEDLKKSCVELVSYNLVWNFISKNQNVVIMLLKK